MLCTAALLCPAFALSHGSETRSLARQGDCAVGSPGRFTAREQQNKQQTKHDRDASDRATRRNPSRLQSSGSRIQVQTRPNRAK